MNTAQAHHAKSVADHMIRYAKPFITQMEALERTDPKYYEHMSIAEFKARVNSELGGMLSNMEQVIDDMYPTFPPDVLNA